jgi:CRP-like cAMP-binding protein
MAIDALIAPLLRVRLFHGLSTQQIGAIARRAERIMYRDGAVISEEGDAADAAVLIVSGPTERVAAGEREAVEPGSLIGEMAMLTEHTYGSTVIARGPVKAMRLPRAAMHALMLDDQSLADHMVEHMSQRLSTVLHDLQAIDQALAAPQSALASMADALAALPAAIATPERAYLSIAAH